MERKIKITALEVNTESTVIPSNMEIVIFCDVTIINTVGI